MAQTQESQLSRTGDQAAGNGTAIARRAPMDEREVTYTPFQSTEKITLTAGMVIKFLCRPTKRGAVCSPEHAVRFMMLCKARSLNPWEGDAFLVGYDGQDGPEFNLITAHQAFLKRAEAHESFEGMESGVMLIDSNDVITEVQGDFIPPGFQLVGGWSKVYRKDRKIPCYRRLNLNVFNKGYSQWKSNPQGMIVKVAEADALRSSFPNSLAGMFLEGEMEPTSRPVESHVQSTITSDPGVTRTDALTTRLVKEKKPKPAPEPIVQQPEQPAPQTENPVDTAPASDTTDAPSDAGESSQEQEPPKEEAPVEKIRIAAPQSFLSHDVLLTHLYSAMERLTQDEAELGTWLEGEIKDVVTDKSKQNKMTPGARRKVWEKYVESHNGEVVKAG